MGKLNKFWFAGGFAAAASLASADVFWTGASATNNWSNAFNWFGFDRPDNDWSDWVCFDSSGVRSSPNVNESYNIKGILFDNFYGSAVQYSIVGTGTLGMTLGIENLMSSAQGVFAPIRLDGNATFWNYDDSTATHAGLLLVGSTINLNNRTLFLRPSNNNITLSGAISGTGGLYVDGPGKVVLGATNSFVGTLWVANGTLEISFGANLGSFSSVISFDGQNASATPTFRRSTTGGVSSPINLGTFGGRLANPAGTTVTYLGGIQSNAASTSAALYKTEAGTAVLQGTLSYTGPTVVRAGTLRVESTLPPTPVVVDAAGTLELIGGVHLVSAANVSGLLNLANGAELAAGLAVFGSGGAIDVTGTITGLTGRLTKRGTDTAYLRTANTYGGGTLLGAGTTIVKNAIDSATGPGPVTLINSGATLAGDGRIAGIITANAGTTISPGDPTGDLRTGNVTFLASSTLKSRVAGATQNNIGRLNSSGAVSLTGSKLEIQLLNNFRPRRGELFELVRAANVSGVFSSVDGVIIPGLDDVRLAVVYNDDSIDLVVAVAARPGDANLDQTVNFSDLLLLAQNYGATSTRTWVTGDFNGDGSAAFADLLTLAQFYNSPATLQSDWATARAIVPEPATLSLLLASGLLLARRR